MTITVKRPQFTRPVPLRAGTKKGGKAKRNPAELLVLGNPRTSSGRARSTTRRRGNPAELLVLGNGNGEQLYDGFHQEPADKILAYDRTSEQDGLPTRTVMLGDFDELVIDTSAGPLKIDSQKYHTKLASNVGGTQLYCVGGQQNLNHYLAEDGLLRPGATAPVRLGTAREITYRARKQMDGANYNWYVHEFGEETGKRPEIWYDPQRQRIEFRGGDYTVEDRGIVN